MTDFTLPRYFVGHPNLSDSVEPSIDLPPLHVVDAFFAGSRHLAEREWVIVVDEAGDLRALPRENRRAFSESLQNQLAYNEISRQRPARLIEAIKIHLFNLQIVEQVATNSPGLNDPVYLYGTLYELGSRAAGIKGQLTVTRGDLLAALLNAADAAFRYHEAFGGGYSRLFQLLLPADTEAEIKRGAGIVLAYPLFPAELLMTGATNEIIISQLIYDLLVSLKEDLQRERITHSLTTMTLPVPSRFKLERDLETQGYKIEGDSAIKENDDTEGGFKGLLASIFGDSKDDELVLPPEGTIEDFLILARDAFLSLQKHLVTPRVVALRNCLKAAPTGNQSASSFAAPEQTIASGSIDTSAPPASGGRRANKAPINQATDWVKDFTAPHQTGDSKSKITSTLEMKPLIISAAPPKSKTEKQKEWRQDFAGNPPRNSNDEIKDEEKKARTTGKKPDWMKDFE